MSPSVIVAPDGTPARKPSAGACPTCGSEKRVGSAGFGVPHPVCVGCGHEFHGEVWRG